MLIRELKPTAPSQLLIINYDLRMGEPQSRHIKPATLAQICSRVKSRRVSVPSIKLETYLL